jgi:ELWxxDGT repeat protein
MHPLLRTSALFLLVVAAPLGAQTVPCPENGLGPRNFRAAGAWVSFSAEQPPRTWISDGSAAGTRPLTELCGPACREPVSAPSRLGAGFLFGTPEGLWFSAGTPGETRLLRSWPANGFVVMPGEPLARDAEERAFLQVFDELWVTDGTTSGTASVFRAAVGAPGSGVTGPHLRLANGPSGSEAFFSAEAAPGGPAGWWVWRTRGLGAPEFSGPEISNFAPFRLAATATRAFYFRGSPVQGGVEAWSTDGTAGGARQLGSMSSETPLGLVASESLAHFFTASPRFYRVWRTDGTAGSLSAITVGEGFEVLSVGKAEQGPLADLLLLRGIAPFTLPRDRDSLVAVDALGTRILGQNLGPYGEPVLLHTGTVLFVGFDPAHGVEPWSTDGTVEGTRRVADLCPGVCSSDSRPVASVAGRAFWLARSGGPGSDGELWVQDSPAGGFRRLTPPGVKTGPASGSAVEGLGAAAGEVLYFAADRGRGAELWVSDGTSEGTRPLLDAAPDDPAPPAGPWLEGPGMPGFRVKVHIESAGTCRAAAVEPTCLQETVCLSGALPGRAEVFLRVVGPKPNGKLWPTIFRATTSTVHVWIEQIATGVVRYYELRGSAPGRDELDGLFDRLGFEP